MRAVVIDDDNYANEYLSHILESMGFVIYSAINGKTAIQYIREFKSDIVVTDIIMEECEGLETIIRIREHDRMIPIIVISGADNANNYMRNAMMFGASVAMYKPIDRMTFEANVRKLCPI